MSCFKRETRRAECEVSTGGRGGPAPVIERGIPRSGDVSILDGRKACEERKLFIKTVLRQNVDKKGSHSCAYRF